MSLAAVVLLFGLAPAHAQDGAPATADAPATEDAAKAPEKPAEAPKADANGSPEEAVRQSLLLMRAGETTKWMDTLCVPVRCESAGARQELESYMLKQATKSAGNCLYGDDDALKVTSVKGDPAVDSKLSIRIECTHTKYPPPAVVEKVDGKWYVSSIPW